MLQQQIQLYNGKKDNIGNTVTLESALQTIPSFSLKPFVLSSVYAKMQAATDPEEKTRLEKIYDDNKGKLPAATWSGSFALATVIKGAENVQDFIKGKITWADVRKKKIYFERTRAIEQLMNYSGIICLDIDKLSPKELTYAIDLIKNDPYTYGYFISPSGAGIKILVRVTTDETRHTEAFLQLQDYYLKKYSLKLDKSGKDVSRLCFLCYNPDFKPNEKAKKFTPAAALQTEIPQPDQQKAAKLTKAQQTDLQATDEDLYSVIHFTDKVTQYTEGNRNNYIHLFACNANRKGFSLTDCLGFSTGHFSDKPTGEVESTVKSAYTHNAHEHAKFKKQAKSPKPAAADISAKNGHGTPVPVHVFKPVGAAQAHANGTEPGSNGTAAEMPTDFKPFWRKYKIKKGKGEEAYEKEIIELSRVDFSDYLFENGFHLLPTGKEGYQMCHSGQGVIKPVEPHNIKQYVLKWTRDKQLRDVEEMLRKGQKQYFASNELDSLPYKKIDVKKDTKDSSFFYFNNCWVSVTADEIKTHSYSELKEYIWEGNKIDKDFTLQAQVLENAHEHIDPSVMQCEFAKFIYLFSYNPDNDEEKDFEPDTIDQRFWSIATSYGFLLDGYKHPAERKGIFAIDHKIGDKGEQHGPTGKSIIPKAASYLKVTATINGKSFKPDYQFKYEPITRDAQIVNFNDMQRTFDVEQIFEVIADDYSVIRRSNGYIHFTYYDSPKVFYSTNFTPNGEGASYAGRMHVIEASDYFSDKHSPYTEFNRSLFTDWDPEEWNRFFNFSMQCVQALKTVGLVKYPKSNFDMRKLISSVVPEFIDFMDVIENCPRNKRIEKIELLEKFNTSMYVSLYGQKLKPHTFHKWVKQYAKNKLLTFNPHKNGSFDKSNGKEYYVLADEHYKPEMITSHATDLFTPTK